jgi:hypothetical protein
MNETQIKNKGYLKFNRNNAIALYCRHCFGYDGLFEGTIGTTFTKAGMEVKECESKNCPLFYFRNGKDERPDRKVRIMTTDHKQKFLHANKQRAQKSKKALKD